MLEAVYFRIVTCEGLSEASASHGPQQHTTYKPHENDTYCLHRKPQSMCTFSVWLDFNEILTYYKFLKMLKQYMPFCRFY